MAPYSGIHIKYYIKYNLFRFRSEQGRSVLVMRWAKAHAVIAVLKYIYTGIQVV